MFRYMVYGISRFSLCLTKNTEQSDGFEMLSELLRQFCEIFEKLEKKIEF